MPLAISDLATEIGWHLHGSQWVWGIAEYEGCAKCDAAYKRWISDQRASLTTEEQLKAALLRRKSKVRPRAEEPSVEGELAPLSKKERARIEMKRKQRTLF